MTRKGYVTDINDAEETLLQPLIEDQGPMGRPRTLDLREVVNALFY